MIYEHIVIAGLEAATSISLQIRSPERSIHAEGIQRFYDGKPYSVVRFSCSPRQQANIWFQITELEQGWS